MIIVLRKRYGRYATPEQLLDIAERRQRLSQRLESHDEKAETYLCPSRNIQSQVVSDIYNTEDRWMTFNDGEHDEGSAEPNADPDDEGMPSEARRALMPSSYGWAECEKLGLTTQATIERRLRIAQLDTLLIRIRDLVSWRTYQYSTDIRHGQGNYTQTTSSWKRVHQTTDSLKRVAMEYDLAREALMKLNPNKEVQNRFRVLKREDLKTIDGIYDPNVRGQRHKTLSWIWAEIVPPSEDTIGRTRFAAAGEWLCRRLFYKMF